MKDEYARVGVPMMPVVHGETRDAPPDRALHGPARRADAAAGRVRLLRRDLRGRRAAASAAPFLVLARAPPAPRRPPASALRTYLFSLAYLAVLFGAMVLDARVARLTNVNCGWVGRLGGRPRRGGPWRVCHRMGGQGARDRTTAGSPLPYPAAVDVRYGPAARGSARRRRTRRRCPCRGARARARRAPARGTPGSSETE